MNVCRKYLRTQVWLSSSRYVLYTYCTPTCIPAVQVPGTRMKVIQHLWPHFLQRCGASTFAAPPRRQHCTRKKRTTPFDSRINIHFWILNCVSRCPTENLVSTSFFSNQTSIQPVVVMLIIWSFSKGMLFSKNSTTSSFSKVLVKITRNSAPLNHVKEKQHQQQKQRTR